MSDIDQYWFELACRQAELITTIQVLISAATAPAELFPISPTVAIDQIRRRLSDYDTEQAAFATTGGAR